MVRRQTGIQVLSWDLAVGALLGRDQVVWTDNLEQNTRQPDQHIYNFGHSKSQVFQRSLGIRQSHKKKRLDSLTGKGTSHLDHSLEDNQIQSDSLLLEGILVAVTEDIWNYLDSHWPWKGIRSVTLTMSIQAGKHNGSPAHKDPAWRHPDPDGGLFETPDTGHLQIC